MAYNRGKIRGITIEIGGDTTQFEKAMSNVDGVLKNTQSKLKDIDRLLKLDPKNTELLKQKQEALDKALGNTKTRLDVLNEALAKAKMNNAPQEQIEALNREIAETEQKLKNAEKEAQNFGSIFSQQAQAVGKEFKDAGEKISNVGKDLSVKLTAPIVALGTVGINYNAQMEQYRTMFTTLTGSAEEADRVISQLQADAQKSPFDSASLIQANQYLISAGVSADEARVMINNLGNAVAATGGGSAELERMSQNLQQIKNVGKATSQDIKQFANAGINIYGLLAEATGKTVEEVKEMDVSYDLLAETFAKASGEGGKYYGAMEAQGETLNGSLNATKESIQMLLGSITQSAMPIIVKVLNYVKQLVDRFSQLNDRQKRTILIVGSVVAAIGPLLVAIGQATIGIGGIISTAGKLHGWLTGTMMPWLTGTLVPWITGTMLPFLAANGPIILGIGAVIAAGVLLWKNWDTVKQKAQQLFTSIKTVFTNIMNTATSVWSTIKSTISDKISGIYSSVTGTFDRIRSFLSDQVQKLKNIFNFEWKLPQIKLPHFFNSGNTGPLGLPKIQVEWYSKAMRNGMILDSPTIFGASNGRLLGGGEAGSETIVGTNSLMNMIRQASQGTSINGDIIINMNVPKGANGKQLVDQIEKELSLRMMRRSEVY